MNLDPEDIAAIANEIVRQLDVSIPAQIGGAVRQAVVQGMTEYYGSLTPVTATVTAPEKIEALHVEAMQRISARIERRAAKVKQVGVKESQGCRKQSG
jgi:hypothetical protein